MKTYQEYMDHYAAMANRAQYSLAKVEAYESVLAIIEDSRIREMMLTEIIRGKTLLEEATQALSNAAKLTSPK